MAFNLGSIIRDRYKINRRLGSGNWGVTYLAIDLQAQKSQNSECVVKEIKPSKSLTLAKSKYYFEREVKALQILGKSSQIPSLRDSFIEQNKFYIVREFIVGTVLSKKIKPGNRLPENEVKKLLIDLLNIVNFIHDKQHIHRDLNPDNIIQRDSGELIIIDFGTVKEINTLNQTNSGNTLSRITGTPPYIAPERYAFPRPQEFDMHPRIDIYSLGIIGLQAITGLAPDSLYIDPHHDGARLWSDAIPISLGMKNLLNKMAHPNHNPGYRYQDTSEILEDLRIQVREQKINLLQKTRSLCRRQVSFGSYNLPYGFPILLLSCALLIGLIKQCSQPNTKSQYSGTNPQQVISSTEQSGQQSNQRRDYINSVNNQKLLAQLTQTTQDFMSSGEEILNGKTAERQLKIQATQLYRQGKYLEAAKVFREYWNAGNKDAEALIYLNNALIESTAAQYYTIAVVVPFPEKTTKITNNVRDLGDEILQGVAKAQEEANLKLFTNKLENEDYSQLPNIETLKQKILQGKRLKVVIATDYNNQQQGKQIAIQLSEFPNLLGVIGHYKSDVTLNTINIYNDNQLTLISPTSNSAELTDFRRPFFFRTIPSIKSYGEALANYLINTLDITEAVIFYNSDPRSFSYAYWQEFKTRFENKQGEIILESGNFNSSKFNPRKALKRINQELDTVEEDTSSENAVRQDIALVLLPDAPATESFNNAQKIIQLNNNRHWIVGAETLYNPQTIKFHQNKSWEKVAIAIPWHYSNSINSNFVRESQNIWQNSISYPTAYAYDAAQVFIQALNRVKINNPTSRDIQSIISQKNFSSPGATGNIEFTSQGNRKQQNIELVTISDCESQVKVFVTLDNKKCFP